MQQALPLDARNVLYLQVADSAPSGVVAAFRDALDVFRIDPATLPMLRDLRSIPNRRSRTYGLRSFNHS